MERKGGDGERGGGGRGGNKEVEVGGLNNNANISLLFQVDVMSVNVLTHNDSVADVAFSRVYGAIDST